ncbi:MAG TPA: TonB-dependent receptor plug domain-containing protein, partial [Saprospiraceae bacterium]|nr:TonB-dependent receptor plug domain-containing protein [Saprospiraceae bacterium]
MKHLLPSRKRTFPKSGRVPVGILPLAWVMALLCLAVTSATFGINPPNFSATAFEKPADRKITGTVVSDAGEPLIGVSIKVKGTTIGASTDEKGSFSLDAPEGSTLIFSYVGYETQEVALGASAVLRVVMTPAASQINEVVVVGYGTQKKKELTGSVSVLSSKDLENRGNTQFGYAMTGKAAGVQIIRSSGQPQSGFSMRVRGTASITSGSDPLYVVDGVPTYNVSEINPADIESISVLKDASSAAVFGSSGANGVVLITTKRGRNQKLQLNLNASATLS